MRIYAVFTLTGATLFALLVNTTQAPARQATPVVASPVEEPPAPAPVIATPDPWANTWPSTTAASPRPPFEVRLAAPIIGTLPRVDVKVDPSPGVASIASTIEVLAVTSDARSAVTADVHRSVRLWPTLDGKREPLVIHMRAPDMLAIVRDPDAFVIAGVDTAGQLELLRATPHGETTQRVEIELPRPLVAVHATTRGFVVLRDDRAAMVLDLDGTRRGELVSEPGEYLASIAVHGDRALAIIERDEKTHGRWIDLATGQWGAETASLPILADHVVLSPDHERVAGFRRGKRGVIATVALASGTIVDTMKALGTGPRLVGFVDDNKVVVTSENRAWWRGSKVEAGGQIFVTASGVLIGGADINITVTSPGEYSKYIGYRMTAPVQMRAAGDGYVATDGDALVRLDARFRTRAGYDVSEIQENIGQISLVDGRHALGYSAIADRSIYLLSTNFENATLVATQINWWEYEPTSRLLHYSTSSGEYLARFDPQAAAFDTPVKVDAKPGELVLLDATEKKGEVAIMVRVDAELSVDTTFGVIKANAFVKTDERKLKPSDEWWDNIRDPRMLVRSQQARARSLDGTLVAELRESRLSLRDGDTVRWTVPSAGASQLLWTPRGELVVFGSGMATVDLATGALRDRQCGMWFGAWDVPPETFGSSLLCEEP